MSKKLKDFGLMFACQLVLYFIITLNYRAIANGLYLATFMTDLTFASLSYFVIRKIANVDDKERNIYSWSGYALGGAVGSVFAIFISKILFKN